MAYHEAFWAVVGAAAPVIALASIVSVSDMMNHAFEWSRYRRDRPRRAVRELTERSALGMLTKFSIITQATNLVLQALALLFALLSLAAAVNMIPRWIAIVIEVIGLPRLAIGALATYRVKITQRLIRDLMDG
jgi:hypothetical protein